MIDEAPWRFVLTLSMVAVNDESVIGTIDKAGLPPSITDGDVEEMLLEGDPYQIQIEPEYAGLPIAVVDCRLRQKVSTTSQFEFTFSFQGQSDELTQIVRHQSS